MSLQFNICWRRSTELQFAILKNHKMDDPLIAHSKPSPEFGKRRSTNIENSTSNLIEKSVVRVELDSDEEGEKDREAVKFVTLADFFL